MLVLFETSAGYAVFKLMDEKKLQEADNLYNDFESPDKARNIVKLKHFQKFKDTTEALASATATVEGKMSKTLKKMLKKVVSDETKEQLLVADTKLGQSIKEKLNISVLSNSSVQELMRCIRSQSNSLIEGLPEKEMAAFSLGLAHSLSRYKLKFSPDKVDTMIVQAISLLDDLDKELNNYNMRCREWYGWHFPELGKIITDNLAYAKTVHLMGDRVNCSKIDFSAILPEEIEQEMKKACEISMGTEVSEIDIINIRYLCDQIKEISDYRAQLYDYLKNRMMAIAPNLTVLVGELVGARLIAHAGSLLNLAKHPSSTVQILGAEKALFRALKTKHDTPKYGLIYHASLIGQAAPKNKGKASRMLAAKSSLALRVDALGEDSSAELGIQHRANLEMRLKALEEGYSRRISGTGRSQAKWAKYENRSEVKTYNASMDFTLPSVPKKRKIEEVDKSAESTPKKLKQEPEEDEAVEVKSEKKKKKKKRDSEGETAENSIVEEAPAVEVKSEKKKKKKKRDSEGETAENSIVEEAPEIEVKSEKKKKKKKRDSEGETAENSIVEETPETPVSEKKKKRKKSMGGEDEAETIVETETPVSEKKKKKKKSLGGGDEADTAMETTMETETPEKSEKKKKKKKKVKEESKSD